MNVEIRNSRAEDIEAYTALLQKTYEAAYTNEAIGLTADCFSKEIFATKDTQAYLRSHLIDTNTQKTWLAFLATTLVGSITCTINNKLEAELTGFYVDPDFQGNGIGKSLYNLAVAFAGERDLLLDIYTHNIQTIAIYRKWGWGLDTSRGDNGYFYRHWQEWPEGLQAKCVYMKKKRL